MELQKYASIFQRICAKTLPGKKKVQKLFYLIERKGVLLDLNYSIHYFGPYSSKLDGIMHLLEIKDFISIDTTKPRHEIRMQDGFDSTISVFSEEEERKVNYIIDSFCDMSAAELEALTTSDYVATSILKDISNDKDIVDYVKIIKGDKFPDDLLYGSVKKLHNHNFV